jgi:hypothetical protein
LIKALSRFWELAIKTTSPGAQKRLLEFFATAMQSLAQEAKDRTHKYIRTIDEFFEIRGDTIGVKPLFTILELGLNLPDEAVCHPVINELSTLALEMIFLDNVSRGATTHSEINSYCRT